MKNNHFLRPVLTEYIIQRLQQGDSINLHGKPGIGKTRMLEDIRNSELDDIRIILVSFKGYQHSYKGFCRAVWSESGLNGNPPASLNRMIEKLHEAAKQVFLLIDDFHYLPENPDIDSAYDQKFIDTLNSVKNTSGVSLLAVTEKPVNTLILFIEKQPKASVLNLSPVEVTPLQHREIRDEMNRRFEADFLSEYDENLLCAYLNEQQGNYGLLVYYEVRLKTGADKDLDFKKRLKQWRKKFKKERYPTSLKQIVQFEGGIKRWVVVLNPFALMIGKLRTLANQEGTLLNLLIGKVFKKNGE